MSLEKNPSGEKPTQSLIDSDSIPFQSFCEQRFLQEHFPAERNKVWIADSNEHSKFTKKMCRMPSSIDCFYGINITVLEQYERALRVQVSMPVARWIILENGRLLEDGTEVLTSSFAVTTADLKPTPKPTSTFESTHNRDLSYEYSDGIRPHFLQKQHSQMQNGVRALVLCALLTGSAVAGTYFSYNGMRSKNKEPAVATENAQSGMQQQIALEK